MSEGRSSGCGIVGFLLIIAILIAAMFAGGWLMLQQTPTETHIILDKEKVRTDTGRAVEAGREMIDQARQNLENSTGDAAEDAGEVDEPIEPPADSPNDSEN